MRDAHNTAIRDRSVTGCWAHRSGTSLLPCNRPPVDDDLGLCEQHLERLREVPA